MYVYLRREWERKKEWKRERDREMKESKREIK